MSIIYSILQKRKVKLNRKLKSLTVFWSSFLFPSLVSFRNYHICGKNNIICVLNILPYKCINSKNAFGLVSEKCHLSDENGPMLLVPVLLCKSFWWMHSNKEPSEPWARWAAFGGLWFLCKHLAFLGNMLKGTHVYV